jgi:hypothetical protein
MQDNDVTPIVDELAAKGKALNRFNVKVTYQTFIGAYDRKGGRALHVVIKCNDKVRMWQRFPIAHDDLFVEPFERMINAYMESAMIDDLAKAADKTFNDAWLSAARNDIAANAVEFSEGAPLEISRIERVLAKGQEVAEELIAEEAIQDREALEEIERLLAEYESAYQIWKDIGARRRRDAGQPIKNQVRAIQAIHENIPAEWIEKFLREGEMTPADMAHFHFAKIHRHRSAEAAEKAIKRARRKKGDILRKQQMSPKRGQKG